MSFRVFNISVISLSLITLKNTLNASPWDSKISSWSSSTLGFKNDDCDDYARFLEELDKLHDKVDSGDLSDFTELKL